MPRTPQELDRSSAGARLRRAIPEIVRRWEAAVRALVDGAGGEPSPVLIDHLPLLLEEVAAALEGNGTERRAPVAHAEQRAAATDYSLRQVLLEYHVLRNTILDVLQTEEALPWPDARVLLDCLEEGIQESVRHFVALEEKELKESEERFRLLVEGVRDYAIFTLDPEGRVSSWNLGAIRITGYEPDQILGQPLERFHTDDEVEQERPRSLLRQAATEGSAEDEGWRVRSDGTRYWAHVTVTALRDDEGRLRGYATITRDITERRAAEEERAALLAEREDAMTAREHLLRVVTHELRNPLQTLSVSSSVLAHPELPADQRQQQVKAIGRGVRRMKRLLDDLWDAARLETGTLSLEKHPVSPRTLAREALLDVADKAAEAGVEVEAGLDDDLPHVLADRDRIVQVLSNLLDNAVKFTPKRGSVRLIAAAEQGEVRFAVSDTGPGIPAQDLQHLFDAYWQGQSGAKGGSGLGLSIVRGLVQAHGGRVWPESSPAGTTFHFTLPVA